MADAEIPVPKAPPPRIVIIRKKKGGHGGHHGGAWKVAYADFVTAMMALFIVLWLLGSDQEVREAIAGYFRDPTGQGKMFAMSMAGAGQSIELPKQDMDKLRERIQQALMQTPNFRDLKDHIEVTITADGLRIELLETEAGMFFESGKAVPTEAATELLGTLASELGKLPNKILVEGHTDSKPFSGSGTYTNWELSADRANSARRLMQAHGVRAEQIAQVRGYADRQLRRKDDPEAASNRRISVIVQWLSPPAAPADPAAAPEKAAPAKEH